MIADNLQHILQQIQIAAEKSGRSPHEIQLVAVSKRKSLGEIGEAFASGQRVFGENFIQEAIEKITILDTTICWHFIGHLQSNKARLAVQHFDVIETVDRIKVARLLNSHADEFGKDIDILVQVNIGREKQKSGIMEEDAVRFLTDLRQFSRVKVRGLMTMPPYAIDPELNRPYFKQLKQLSEILMQKDLIADGKPAELSMGMSSDYLVAIEEGSTLVRIGTAIFGQRVYIEEIK